MQVQSWLQVSNNTRFLNTCIRLWLTESEQATPRGFNKGHSLKSRVGSRVRQTPEEGCRTYWLKHCGNNNKDKDNSLKTLNDKNHRALSQKFRQLIALLTFYWKRICIQKSQNEINQGHFFISQKKFFL